MVAPFTRGGQARTAAQLETAIARLPIVHVVTFPHVTINHVLLIFGVSATASGLEFRCYDPNICEKPILLRYDRASRTFIYPRTHYFQGGKVNVYEVYRGWFF
jgi:hypothetical protein